MGIFDKLFEKKSLRLGKLVVPFKDLRTRKLDEEDFMCVGDTKEAAYEFLQYVCEVAHIKKDEADWDALASIPKIDNLGRPSIEWQFSVDYMGNLLEEWKLETERFIEELYSHKRTPLKIHDLIENIKEGHAQDMEDFIMDTMADIGNIDEMVKMFPDTLKEEIVGGLSGDYKYVGTFASEAIVWALARLSDPSAPEAIEKLRTQEIEQKTEGRIVYPVIKDKKYKYLHWPDSKLCEMAVKKDVDSAVSFLEEIYNFTKKVYQSWEWNISKQEPWIIGTWSSPVFSQSVRPYISREWAWATYILKQWGDKRAIPVLKQLYPLLDFWRRARVKRLIYQFS